MKKILFCIFLLALILRIYNLSNFPAGFHIDEASLGYNAYSILHTGKDDNGNAYPLYIDMFGDNRPSGYHFLTIPSVAIFGLTEFATRFPAALFGALSIFAFYFLVFTIFDSRKIAFLASFLLALAPWHIVLSRASSEAIVALFFILVGFSFIIWGFKKRKRLGLIIGTFLLSFSFFFYHTPRVFVPLFSFAFLVLLFLIRKQYKTHLWSLIISCFFFLVVVAGVLVFSVKGGTGRFSQVNIFNSFETNFQLQQQINEDAKANSNFLVSRLFHNKLSNYLYIFTNNYLSYFGVDFLFMKGGLPIWYSIPRIGIFYILELPFILLGIFSLIRDKNSFPKIIFVWLLVGPVVAAITNDDVPNINRASVLFPVFHIFSAVGFIYLLSLFPKKSIYIQIVVFTLLLLNSLSFLQQYYVNAKVEKPWYRNNGFGEMMKVVRDNYNTYDQIVMTKYQGGIYPLVLFYMQYDPKTYQQEGSMKNKDYGGFGKFIFVPQDCPSLQSSEEFIKKEKVLYIDKGDCYDDKSLQVRKHNFILREDDSRAFRIVYE